MALTPKERELAAVGISVAAGCKPCTDHHVEVARKARASDQEIKEAVVVALAVRKSTAEMMAGYALTRLGEARLVASPRPVALARPVTSGS
jgi:AhpD family alkylhydroperoxidase